VTRLKPETEVQFRVVGIEGTAELRGGFRRIERLAAAIPPGSTNDCPYATPQRVSTTQLDATKGIVDGVTPLAGVVNSPLFNSVPWSAGNTQPGVTQFGDAVMRANFWSSLHGGGSGYHVLLSQPVVLPVQTIQVPAGFAETVIDSAGTRWDSWISDGSSTPRRT